MAPGKRQFTRKSCEQKWQNCQQKWQRFRHTWGHSKHKWRHSKRKWRQTLEHALLAVRLPAAALAPHQDRTPPNISTRLRNQSKRNQITRDLRAVCSTRKVGACVSCGFGGGAQSTSIRSSLRYALHLVVVALGQYRTSHRACVVPSSQVPHRGFVVPSSSVGGCQYQTSHRVFVGPTSRPSPSSASLSLLFVPAGRSIAPVSTGRVQ
eukprot:1625864-Rhodomonas_salina.2